jgi:hypothetical protein
MKRVLLKYKWLLILDTLLAGLFLFKSLNPILAILVIPISYLLNFSMKHQRRKNIVFSLIRFMEYKIKYRKFGSIICIIIGLEMICFLLKNTFNDMPNSIFLYSLILVIPIDFLGEWFKMERIEKYLDKFYGKDVKLIDNTNGTLLIYTKVPLDETTSKKNFEIILNSPIVSITQDPKNKRHFVIKYDKNYSSSYLKHEKCSKERLIEILKSKPFNDNKAIVDNIEHSDVDSRYYVLSTVLKKRLIAQRENIEHKWGCKKGTMVIEFEEGKTIFVNKHTNIKQYYIDDKIPDRPATDGIPFVFGVDRKNGGLIISDILKIQHMLVLGMTGSAKSSVLHSWIYWLMLWCDYITFVMVDLKGTELGEVYQGFNNVDLAGINDGDDLTESIEIVLNLVRKVEKEYYKRIKLFKSVGCKDIFGYNSKVSRDKQIPFIMFIIDEANGIIQTILNKNKVAGEDIINIIDNLMARSRCTGIYSLHTMQELTKENYSVAWRRGMMTKCILKVQELRQAQMAIESNPEIADEAYCQTVGQYIMKDVYNNINRLQNLRVSDKLDDLIYKAIALKYKENSENIANQLPTMGIVPIDQ